MLRYLPLLLLPLIISPLFCDLYDYSNAKVACTTSCPNNSTRVLNYCLSSKQYLAGSQVLPCPGSVSTDRTACCAVGQYVSGTQCLPCNGQIYNDGRNCCPNDRYLDYSTPTGSCVRLYSGSCPSLSLSTPFKICCPSQQLYNVATRRCQQTTGLSCDQTLRLCCPPNQFLEYSQGSYTCTPQCSWRSSQGIRCLNRRCSTRQQQIQTAPLNMVSSLLAINGQCCLGSNGTNTCISDAVACDNSFANRGWSMCCSPGQVYIVSTQTCTSDCVSGYILLSFFCVGVNQVIDFRSPSGSPTQMSSTTTCNGLPITKSLPFCCPLNFYIKDSTGCTLCNGNIFSFFQRQVCCPKTHIYNATSGSCISCEGIIDSDYKVCCAIGNYVRYDTSGSPSCSRSCEADNVYNQNYCCDGMTMNCFSTFRPTSCNPAVMLTGACRGCPGFCSSNSQLCSTSSVSTCTGSCLIDRQILVSGIGCLQCSPSCKGCTSPLSSQSCLSCADGYTSIQNSCQACSVNCLTCSGSTDSCTACDSTLNYELFNFKCYGRCSLNGFYFDTMQLACFECSPRCRECFGSSNGCTKCAASFYLSGSSCVQCPSSCQSCVDSSGLCSTCIPGHYKQKDGHCGFQCTDVMYSIYSIETLCLSCHPECSGCTAHPQNCIGCSSNRTYLNDTLGLNTCVPCISPCFTCLASANCTSCQDGFFLNGFSCSKCHATCATCKGPANSNCLSCVGTSNLNPNGICSGCSSTCLKCTNNLCEQCTSGSYLYSGICLSQCPSSTYSSSAACIQCDVSCQQCNSTACFVCNSGYFLILGSRCYTSCPANYYASNGLCILGNNPPAGTNSTNTTNTTSNSTANSSSNATVNPTSNSTNKTNSSNTSSNSSTNTSVSDTSNGYIIDQTVIIKGNKALVNIYFNQSSNSIYNITINLINGYSGKTIELSKTNSRVVTNNKVSLEAILPDGEYIGQYPLFSTTAVSQNGSISTLLSSQPSNQIMMNKLQNSSFANLKILSYIFSAIILLFILLTKLKGHFSAEEANNLILHAFNFGQVCYLFIFLSTLDEGGYFFLNGFSITHIAFFPNFFKNLIPDYFIQKFIEKSLVPDGNFLRNAGFSVSYQIVVLGLLILLVAVSLLAKVVKGLDEPPYIRKIMRVGSLLFYIGFMNELFFAFVQLLQPSSVSLEYASFRNSCIAASYAIVFIVPIIMLCIAYHFYQTYNSDVLQHYYTLRQISHYMLTYFQALVMALAVGKPLLGLALIPFQVIWFLFNFYLSKYGDAISISDYKKYIVISLSISLAYLFLSLQTQINWVVIVVLVSLTIILLLIYCSYQIVGIYYHNIFKGEGEEHSN